jgi:hypothetical protein
VAVAVQNGFRHRRYRVLTVGAVGMDNHRNHKRKNKNKYTRRYSSFSSWQQFVKGKPTYIKVSSLHS